jgi:hypothetical protein
MSSNIKDFDFEEFEKKLKKRIWRKLDNFMAYSDLGVNEYDIEIRKVICELYGEEWMDEYKKMVIRTIGVIIRISIGVSAVLMFYNFWVGFGLIAFMFWFTGSGIRLR